MSFAIDWGAFAREFDFQSQIRAMLTLALNKNPPDILVDRVKVLDLDWGREAPSLEMLELGDVAKDRFRGVFKLAYAGGASITLATKVQANLFHGYAASAAARFALPRTVAAADSLPIPLHLTLRNIRLQGTVIVAFSATAGLTLVFRNDPLHSVEVTSSLDLVPGISTFLQQQISGHLRQLFRDEVPAALYKLSLRYLARAPPPLPPHASPARLASVDKDRPASLVSILQIESLFGVRRTLAVPVPYMRHVVLRAQLAALLPSLPRLDLAEPEQFAGARSHTRKPPRRRVVRLRRARPLVVPRPAAEGTSVATTPHVDAHLDSDAHDSAPSDSEHMHSSYFSLESESIESTEAELDEPQGKTFVRARLERRRAR